MNLHPDHNKLKDATHFAFRHGATQLTIKQNGRTLFQKDNGAGAVDVFGVQKGVLALLVGIAQEKYLLETLDSINHHLAPEWTHVGPWEEAKLTIESLMWMTTGMDENLNPFGEINKTWHYNNVTFHYLKEILCLQTNQTLNDLSREWLFEPLGMQTTKWVNREMSLPNGEVVTGLVTTADDLSILGARLIDNKKPPLTDQFFLDQLGKPGSSDNPAWGMLWWNNNQTEYRLPYQKEKQSGFVNPNAPRDALFTRGRNGNYLAVVPGHQLVVAMIMKDDIQQTNMALEREFWRKLMAALDEMEIG